MNIAPYVVPPREAAMLSTCAEQPAHRTFQYKLAFYNIGWNSKSEQPRNTPEGLASEIKKLVHIKGVDAVGLSEVFNLKEVAEEFVERRKRIMKLLLKTLNENAAQDPWNGILDGHYIFLWNSSKLSMVENCYVSCGVAEHDWRKAQYFKFHCAKLYSVRSFPPLHVCHCHSPDSRNGKLTDHRRQTIFTTLWQHVLKRDTSEQPVAIFGGDLNCTSNQWCECLRKAELTQQSRQVVQECRSDRIPFHNGDRAWIFNAVAFYESSAWGKYHQRPDLTPISDAHNVVLVPLFWQQPVLSTQPVPPEASKRDSKKRRWGDWSLGKDQKQNREAESAAKAKS